MNEIDNALLRLLALRCMVSREIKDIKKSENLPVYDPLREQKVLEQLYKQNKSISSLLKEQDIAALWNLIFTISKGIQEDHEENNSSDSPSL